MITGTRVRTIEPLGYKRPGDYETVHIAPKGIEGVVADPKRGDPPFTFHVIVDEPDSEHDLAVLPWVMDVQVEPI